MYHTAHIQSLHWQSLIFHMTSPYSILSSSSCSSSSCSTSCSFAGLRMLVFLPNTLMITSVFVVMHHPVQQKCAAKNFTPGSLRGGLMGTVPPTCVSSEIAWHVCSSVSIGFLAKQPGMTKDQVWASACMHMRWYESWYHGVNATY